jgi:hypothetical protein
MSDRVLVMRSGRIVGEMSGSEGSEERVLALATLGTRAGPHQEVVDHAGS